MERMRENQIRYKVRNDIGQPGTRYRRDHCDMGDKVGIYEGPAYPETIISTCRVYRDHHLGVTGM